MKPRRPLLISAIALLCLALLISFAPALVLKHQLHSQLQQLGAEQTAIKSLYLNPWSGYFELQGLSATATGHPDLQIGRLLVEIDYSALWSKRLQITQLQLADVELHLQQEEQRWRVGPLLQPLSEAGTNSDDQPPSQWRGGINGFNLSNINSSINNTQMSHQLIIEQAILQQLHQWSPSQQTQFSLQGRLNDSPLALSTQGTPLADQPVISLDLTIESLALGALAAPWVSGLQGQLSTDLTLQFEQLDNGFSLQQSGSLDLSEFAFEQPGTRSSSELISWQGYARQQLIDGRLAQARSDTKLQIKQLKLTLAESQIELQEQALQLDGQLVAEGTQQLRFEGTFSSAPSQLQMPDLNLRQQARSWTGNIEVELSESGLVKLISNGVLQLQGLQLQQQQSQLSLNEQQIELKGRLETDTKALQFNGSLQTQPSQISFEHLRLATQSRLWQGTLGVDIASAALSSLSGDINIGALQLSHQDGSALLGFEQLQLNQLQAPQPNQVDVESLQLQGLVIGAEQPLLKLDRLDIATISASAQRSQIGTIHPGALDLRVDLDADLRPFRWNAWLAQLSASSATTAPPTSESTASVAAAEQPAGYPFSLGEFALQKPAQIQILEPSKRPYKTTLTLLRISDIDSRSDQVSPFALNAQANRFGNIQLEGDYALFATTPQGRWQGKIAGMELPPFSPFMQSQTGYQIDSGKLKLNTQGSLASGEVESRNKMEIHNFSVNPASKAAADTFDGSLGMPLGTAISLLTDRDDNVALDIPINGKLSDPKFGIQSVLNILIAKVTREAAVGYLALTLQPYGALIGLTRLAVDAIESSSINLEPVYFEPGSTVLTPTGLDYLGKIGKMLNERKGLRLKLCGRSVAADKDWLLAQRPAPAIAPTLASAAVTSSAAQPALPLELPLSESEQDALLEMAEERGFSVKSQLLQLAVQDDQLFSCTASVDSLDEGRPLVRIGL